MIDLLLVAIIAVIAWCVSGEGAYHAGSTLIIVIISGLLAMNYFEPLANGLQNNIAAGSWSGRWDMIALIGLFVVFVTVFRLISDKLVPTYIQVHPLLHQAASWSCGVLSGYVTMAFLLTALHTAPMPRDYWGYFYPERERRAAPLSGFGPDYQWLGFTQYATERPFASTVAMNSGQEQYVMTRMFDGRNGWLENIPEKKDSNQPYDILPSFPIRYAVRREQLEAVGGGNTGQVKPAVKKKGDGGSESGGQAVSF